VEVDDHDASNTCYVYGRTDEDQRVEIGLYVCEACDAAFNADVNGAEIICFDINERNSESAPIWGGDRSFGWLAKPAVYLHELSYGFSPRTQDVDCKN
jgi:putative transposase